MKAVVMKKVGGTDVMEFVDRPDPVVMPGIPSSKSPPPV